MLLRKKLRKPQLKKLKLPLAVLTRYNIYGILGQMKKTKTKLVTWAHHRQELLKDTAVLSAYQDLQPELEIIKKIIEARVGQGISQEKLAQKMKTKQSAISRLETGRGNPSLDFLQRLANALDSRLEVRFLPK